MSVEADCTIEGTACCACAASGKAAMPAINAMKTRVRIGPCPLLCILQRRTFKEDIQAVEVRFGSRLCENPTDAMIPLLNRGGVMKGFVQGADRQQTTLLPECLDDWVDESNPVRAVYGFVDALELRALGFDVVDRALTALPG